MREVVSSGTLSVKVNGLMGGYFKCGKGVRQGDPLSPLLFNLAADSLAKIIHKAQENNLIEGLVPEYVQKGIAVLQYADDTILCLKDDLEIVQNMKLLLYIYEKMSGLKIIFSKNEVLMISHNNQRALQLANVMNCSTGVWPIKYLGVPVAGSRLHVSDWVSLVEKLMKRLEGWQGSALSIGGRITLINACLSSIPTYCVSMYLLPKTNFKKMDSVRKGFFGKGEELKGNIFS
jgi:mannosylglycoprotein endo-beta-mannosidase